MYLSSPPLQVLAALQDDSLITSEECKHLWYHTDVILVQSLNSKSPEEIRRTATVLRIFQFKNESEYLRGKHRLGTHQLITVTLVTCVSIVTLMTCVSIVTLVTCLSISTCMRLI